MNSGHIYFTKFKKSDLIWDSFFFRMLLIALIFHFLRTSGGSLLIFSKSICICLIWYQNDFSPFDCKKLAIKGLVLGSLFLKGISTFVNRSILRIDVVPLLVRGGGGSELAPITYHLSLP